MRWHNTVGRLVLADEVRFVNGKKEISVSVPPGLYLARIKVCGKDTVIKFEVR